MSRLIVDEIDGMELVLLTQLQEVATRVETVREQLVLDNAALLAALAVLTAEVTALRLQLPPALSGGRLQVTVGGP